mmetsp:Transcript_550/g.843  ORF Transcript_550/g.843 Transcript_550/m.843 type:complete len:332 (-) Transcript_550:1929-2924(-)|eukprot:CAMPEP_0194213978 /NCGR_PEP_ID=MMETSP0156-20130528/14939_1 /TAXON_ID=33649 /ORGANISM="Thalassionema nitzschioides, Strain L26-B" /LENGTH=331 /DNA_ID=CAMNT_0038942139 /DNA_START=142 /DNA_END=1137 /DNA_ORIENTATION=-
MQTNSSPILDIEDIHTNAVKNGEKTYIDPSTGFTCFTELAHLDRGVCCGRVCRHCPYGWSNVENGNPREAKVTSGNREAVQKLINDIRNSEGGKEDIKTRGRGGRHGGALTKKNVPYTRGGDKGTSQLLTGERRSKDDIVFEAMGTVDELCTVVGVAHAELLELDCSNYGELSEHLLDIMSRLFDVGSHVANPKKVHSDDEDTEEPKFIPDGVGGGFDIENVDVLEDWIDKYTEEIPELNSFILPTGSKVAAQLQVARTVCRRAERRVVELVEEEVCDPNVLKYVNRLSDYFFTASRYANHRGGKVEVMYCRPNRKSKQRRRVQISSEGGR